jgi:hypothetical protein
MIGPALKQWQQKMEKLGYDPAVIRGEHDISGTAYEHLLRTQPVVSIPPKQDTESAVHDTQ